MTKKIFIIAYSIGLSFCAQAQQPAPVPYNSGAKVNYIRTWAPQKPYASTMEVVSTDRTEYEVREATEFFDGLGRTIQTVNKKGALKTGDSALDLVVPIVYDEFGRETFKYLPFAANQAGGNTSLNDGKFKLNPFQQDSVFTNSIFNDETFFYAKKVYDGSPLNRVLEEFAPGNSWAGTENEANELDRRSLKKKYWINTDTDSVRIWDATIASAGNLSTYSTSSTYAQGELNKIVSIDEHNKQVIEFIDKEGNVILKKVQLTAATDTGGGAGHSGWLNTYFIYNDLGLLCAVVQPKGVELLAANSWNINALSGVILNEQCFQYGYDQRNRRVIRKAPGAGAEYMVYDLRDRLAMKQDANFRAQSANKWLVFKYDDLNRPIETYSGTTSSSVPFSSHLNSAYNTSSYYYPTGSTSWSGKETLSKTYYDSYSGVSSPISYYYTSFNSYFEATDNDNWPYPQMPVASNKIKGLVTSTEEKVLGTTSTYIKTTFFYDDKGRLIQTLKQNQANGTDAITTQYSWNGTPLKIVEQYSKGTQSQTLATKMIYDALGRIVEVKRSVQANSVTTVTKAEQSILKNEYDELGRLRSRILSPDYNNGAGLETQGFEYNIRGWSLGMNRDFARDASSGHFFGFDLGYDKVNNNLINGQSYTAAQYNGNVAGTVWKSVSDNKKRKYDYKYDAANRILKATFTQYDNSNIFSRADDVIFDLTMGDGNDPNLAYDANGNIKEMHQWGLKVTSSSIIDSLFYTYQNSNNSNKLAKVSDAVPASGNGALGDFKDGSNGSTDDYTYDANGNLKKDLNKNIGNSSNDGVTYNYLNQPQVVTVRNGSVVKGTVTYTYDAKGTKLKKVVVENAAAYNGNISRTTTTDYIGRLVFESMTDNDPATTNYTDVMQFVNTDEGRVRYIPRVVLVGSILPARLENDYYLKDHLDNIRMVLTEEERMDKYPVATLETAKLATEKNYYYIEDGNIADSSAATGLNNYTNDNGIGNNPSDPAFESATSEKLYRLNSNAAKMGLGITLRVMAGDTIDVLGKSYYFQNNPGSGYNSYIPVLDLLNAFLNTPASLGSAHGINGSAINTGPGTAGINAMMATQTTQNSSAPLKPRASVNVIFFDEQFKTDSTSFALSMVGDNGIVKDHFNELQNLTVSKNGYVYIYCSNETPVDVFFDNLQVVHRRGRILEETHYYPFGLTMAGISSKAAGSLENKIKFQGQEFASREFSDDSGLEMYEFKWRMDDPQTGRFWQVDPLADKYVYNSTYAFSENKVTAHVELEGLEAWAVNPTTVNGSPGLSATVVDINAPFSVTQGGVTTGYFPNADMNRQLGGAIVSNGSLLVPTNANGDYNSYSGEGIQNFNYMTSNMAATPTTTVNVITNGAPVVIAGERIANGPDATPVATVGATTVTTPAINSATAPTVSLTYSDQAGLPNTFTVTDNSNGAQLINQGGRGSVTRTATGFVSGSTMSVRTTEQQGQRGDGYNFTLTVTPTVSTPTVVPTPAATANQLRIEQGKSKSLLNNVSLY